MFIRTVNRSNKHSGVAAAIHLDALLGSIEICIGDAAQYAWRSAAGQIISSSLIDDAGVFLAVTRVSQIPFRILFRQHSAIRIAAGGHIDELLRVLLAGNLYHIVSLPTDGLSHIALLSFAVSGFQLEGAARIHSPELVLRREPPLASPPFGVSHIVLRLLDGTSQRGNLVFRVEIIVESVALVSCQSIVVLGERGSPAVIIPSGVRVSGSGLDASVRRAWRE